MLISYRNPALVLACLVSLSSAFAADSQGKFIVLSLGTKSCGQVVTDFEKNDWGKLTNSVWVGGYLTAINSEVFKGEDVAKGTDPAARDLWVYNYCKSNPLESLYRATDALVSELIRRAR
jgi:hypothetical protein